MDNNNQNLNTDDSLQNSSDNNLNDDLNDDLFETEEDEDTSHLPLPWYRKLRYVVMGCCVIIFIFSAVALINIFSEYKRGEDIYESIQGAVFVEGTTALVPEGTTAEKHTYEEYTTKSESVSYAEIETEMKLEDIDMAAVHNLSANAIGWIQIPAIGRSYPIAYTDNNSYYLTHTFTGEENSAGSIFMDARNFSNFSDKNTIIYGHNMKNGTMFGMLNRFEKKDFYDSNNSYYYITTDAGVRAYQIAAICYVPSDSIVYTVDFSGETSFSDLLKYINEHKIYDTGVILQSGDYITTLSTCTSDSSTRRIVIGKYIGTIKK